MISDVTLAVVDTHALIWYAGQRWNKLGRDARRVFEEVEAGNGALFVPALVMVELGEAVRRGQVRLPEGMVEYGRSCSRPTISSPSN